MNGASRLIKDENNPAKIGLIISTLIITGALIPTIKTNLFSIEAKNSLLFLLLGLSMFFFFMGIRVNMNIRFEKVGETMQALDVLPSHYTPLSKFCFLISLILFIIFLLKIFIP